MAIGRSEIGGLNMALAPKIRGLGYTDREDRVDVIAEGIMAKDSPLMQRARATGTAFANRRGLMNSSIAAGAQQGAVLDQVVPMASQNAQQEFQKNRAGQDFGIAGGLAEKDFGYRSDLSKQEAAQQKDAVTTEYGLRESLQGKQQSYETGRDALNKQFEAEQNAFQLQAQERIAELGISGDSARSARTSIDNAFNDYQNSIQSIMGNPKISGEDRHALTIAAKSLLTKQTDYVSRLSSTDLAWPAGGFR